MKKVLSTILGITLLAGTAQAADDDIVIRKGRMMGPETNLDAMGHVGIGCRRLC